MISIILFSTLLNVGELQALPPENTEKIEANRRRGGKHKGDRRRGSGGLR